MIRVADYIAGRLADEGVRHVFLLTGGGAMFLNNAFGQEKRIRCVFNHHEQACAMAAEGYARTSGKVGVINVTTGPGGINALNGVFGAWTDSIPMLVISGQVKRETCMATYRIPGLRQLGDQEADILSMARPIIKYGALIERAETIRYHLERALHLAVSGRPGPVWLDVPIDIQSARIDPAQLAGYDPSEDDVVADVDLLRRQCSEILNRLRGAQRPVILAGSGVRLAGELEVFERLTHRLGIPVTTAWTHDVIASDDPLFCGRPGTIGERAGNFVVQNADVLLVLGSRLNIRQVSYNWKAFARQAYKIQVDIDPAELQKPTIHPDLPVIADLKILLPELERQCEQVGWDANRYAGWLAWCRERVKRYPPVQGYQRHVRDDCINPYYFVEALFERLGEQDIVVSGNATACIVPFQVARLKCGQRLFSNSGSASMGYDLPAAIGASFGGDGRRVICLAGDGSIQLNIQELQTVVHYQLPVKIFVLNNGGYLSIRTTQRNFFGNLVGESACSGVSFPDMVKLAQAYGLPAYRLKGENFETELAEILQLPGPALIDVVLDGEQMFEPRVSSKQLPDGRLVSAPLEDMYPFLKHEELLENLLIPPLEE